MIEEEEREKALKEAKAKSKKGKKQRQKEKKKGKSKEEQLAADQVSEGGGKNTEKQLMQLQPAGVGDDEEELCCVCLDRERDVYLQPCRHVIMCSRCVDEVLAKSSLCPVCRAEVSDFAILE